MKQYLDTPYYVTEYGDVYRNNKSLSLELMKNGYKRVTLSINGNIERHLVHRLVGLLYVNNPLNLPHINHIDNNTANNYYSNLEWVTHSENMIHCHKQNRCSNLVASKIASDLQRLETENKFKNLLGINFISLEGSVRLYINYTCPVCGKLKKSRTDSSVFKNNGICGYCL